MDGLALLLEAGTARVQTVGHCLLLMTENVSGHALKHLCLFEESTHGLADAMENLLVPVAHVGLQPAKTLANGFATLRPSIDDLPSRLATAPGSWAPPVDHL